MGYQYITVKPGWSMFTPTFEDVQGGKVTLSDIVVCNADGVEFDDDNSGAGRSRGKVKVVKLQNDTGDVGTSCIYTSNGYSTKKSTWGWGANGTQTFSSGEGLVINNGHDTDIKLLVSGGVSLEPMMTIPTGWGVFGNNTPVDITLSDITVCNADGVEFDDDNSGAGRSRGKIKVVNLQNDTGDVGTSCIYTSNGYSSKKSTWGWGANGTTSVKAGEALVVNNGHDFPIIFKIKSPVEQAK